MPGGAPSANPVSCVNGFGRGDDKVHVTGTEDLTGASLMSPHPTGQAPMGPHVLKDENNGEEE